MRIEKLSSKLTNVVGVLPGGRQMVSSGQYGLNLVINEINGLSAGSRVLEIGPGACLVVCELAIRFPEIEFYAVDVFDQAFEHFHACATNLSRAYNFHLLKGDICESGDFTKLHYDFIYSIDVIEHSKNPRAFLKNASDLLKPNGRIYVSFPNYHFPFDCHFLIPFLINPNVTKRVFSDRIRIRERDYPGLWNTLNFIKLDDVLRWIKSDMQVESKVSIDPVNYFFRLACIDRGVRDRHPIISTILRIMSYTKMLDFLILALGIKYSPFVSVSFATAPHLAHLPPEYGSKS